MFSKPQSSHPAQPTAANSPSVDAPVHTPAPAKKSASLIGSDLKLEGSITGGSEVQIDGAIIGDVRVERVVVGEGGHVDGGVFAEAVEVRGRVTGSVTAKQASDPKEQATAFKLALDALLDPLVHDGPPPGTQGSAGVVTNTTDSAITIKIASGATLKTGDQVALHAWRLTKNPTTYTLHNLHDEEIGRVTVTAVNGGTATGTFAGDFPPRPGDTAEIVIDAPAAVQGSPNP